MTESEEIKKSLKCGKITQGINIQNSKTYEVYRDRLNEKVRAWCNNLDKKNTPPL